MEIRGATSTKGIIMANICSNKITITGDEPSLEALLKRLIEQDPALLDIIPNFSFQAISGDASDIEAQYFQEEEIGFSFNSKHSCPLDSITTLSSEYPDLNFHVVYEESGTDTYGEADIADGSCSDNSMNELEFLEKYNENYLDEKESLLNLSYEDFIERYTHENIFEDYPYTYLDREVLKRIKNEDLGLFINRQWNDEQALAGFKQRLESGSTIES
jgi:hypothetical protein